MKTYNLAIPEQYLDIIGRGVATSRAISMAEGWPVLQYLQTQKELLDKAMETQPAPPEVNP